MGNTRGVILVAGVLLMPCLISAQSGRPGYDPTVIPNSGSRPGHAGDMFDMGPEAATLRARREYAIKLQKKQRLTASAERLVTLTRQFQADLATHGALTPDDERRLDEIAKAAHDVRSRMLE